MPEHTVERPQWTDTEVVHATPAELVQAINDGLLVTLGFHPRRPLTRP